MLLCERLDRQSPLNIFDGVIIPKIEYVTAGKQFWQTLIHHDPKA